MEDASPYLATATTVFKMALGLFILSVMVIGACVGLIRRDTKYTTDKLITYRDHEAIVEFVTKKQRGKMFGGLCAVILLTGINAFVLLGMCAVLSARFF